MMGTKGNTGMQGKKGGVGDKVNKLLGFTFQSNDLMVFKSERVFENYANTR